MAKSVQMVRCMWRCKRLASRKDGRLLPGEWVFWMFNLRGWSYRYLRRHAQRHGRGE